MILLGFRRALLALAILALAVSGSAAAADDDGRGIDPNQGRSLVEVTLPNKAAAIRLQLADDSFEHRLQRPLSASERQRDGDGHRLRHRRGARRVRRRGLRPRQDDRRPGDLACPARRPASRRESGGAGRRGRARGDGRDCVPRGRDRRPPRRLFRELRRPLPLRRGEGPPRRRGARPARRTSARASRFPGTPARARRSARPRGR